MIDKILFFHAALGIVIQVLFVIFTTSWWLGAIAAIAFYAVREYREYKARVMANAHHWNTYNTLEVVFPAAATIALALIATYWTF